MDDFLKNVIKDRLTGWELVEFLDVDISEVLEAALVNEWINEDNYDELMEHVDFNGNDERRPL